MDLAEWLTDLGLEQHIQTFTESHIDFDVLPDLTERDLEELGLSLGQRKRLLRAVATMALAQPAQAATTEPPALDTEAPAPASHREAERRQITVMFCDLVGSTALSEKLDPEDLRMLIQSYRQACSRVIERYEGHVARYVGDGVLVFFGWPRAHEDDAMRAVYAALEVLSAIQAVPGPVKLSARLGICTGLVVVGESSNSHPLEAMDAVGEAPNIAARLQSLAAPNSVLISGSTRRLVSAAFDLQDLGQQELKGVSKPVAVYRVLSAIHSPSRFEAAHSEALTPLIGRSTELSLLLDRWEKAKDGDGQVVLLSGIPGVGKSRLAHELKSRIEADSYFLLQYQCSPYHRQSAFFPIIDHIENAASLSSQDSDEEKTEKLNTYLSHLTGDPGEVAWLIANLLSISTKSLQTPPDLTPQQIKNRTLSKLVDLILELSRQRPIFCLFEDVHWIDPSTLELLDLIVNRAENARILVVVSFRPEFHAPWSSHGNVTLHSLTRLSRREATGMVRDLSGRQHIPQEVLEQIIERTDGVPLFIEELTSNVLRSPSRNRQGTESLDQNAQQAALKVPETLHDSLMERLDSVLQGRRTAQTAAVIGREFSYDLLCLASSLNEEELHDALSRLEDADIIFKVGVSPAVRFAFKHALLCDAIYNSLLKTNRQRIHAAVAAILEEHLRDGVEIRPEIIAHHYSQAQMPEASMRYWNTSGRRALTQSANVEAIAHFRKALDALSQLPDTSERMDQEIELQLALGVPLVAVLGYPAKETRQAFARARSLCRKRGNPPEQFQALYGLWGHSWMGGKNDEALRMAREFQAAAETTTDTVPLIVAHRTMGSTLLTIGDFSSAQQHFEKTITLSGGKGRKRLRNQYVVEPQAASRLLLSWALWFLGYPDQSLAQVKEALALARELAHPYNIAFAHYMSSVVHLLRGEPELALADADQSLEISEEQRFSLYFILSKISRGRALADLGRLEEAMAEIESGLEEAEEKSVGFMHPMMRSWLARVHAKCGENERALAITERALAEIDDATGRSWEAELHRQRAAILLSLSPDGASEAEAHLKRALASADKRNAKSLELQAASDLADLWRSHERFEEAQELLAPILDWFQEGFETAPLRRAKEVLAALR